MALGGSGFIALANHLSGKHPQNHPYYVVAIALALIAAGVALIRSPIAVAGPEGDSLDARVLRVVKQHQGQVSVAQVADDANITLTQAKESLTTMLNAGLCHRDGDDMVFDEFVTEDSKRKLADLNARQRGDHHGG